jgi:hypothetical protein
MAIGRFGRLSVSRYPVTAKSKPLESTNNVVVWRP